MQEQNHRLMVDSVFYAYQDDLLLQGACIQINTNECVGLLGRNGSGKTTLLKIIFGALNTEDKCIQVDNLTYLKPLYQSKNLISYLPQFHFIPRHLRVKDCFALYDIDFDKIVEVVPEVKFFYQHKIKQLSGGWARMIEVLIVLYSPSLFSILDEPFSHLSPIHVELICELIQSQKSKKGILLTDHIYKQVLCISDKILVLSNKQIYPIINQNDLENYGYSPPQNEQFL